METDTSDSSWILQWLSQCLVCVAAALTDGRPFPDQWIRILIFTPQGPQKANSLPQGVNFPECRRGIWGYQNSLRFEIHPDAWRAFGAWGENSTMFWTLPHLFFAFFCVCILCCIMLNKKEITSFPKLGRGGDFVQRQSRDSPCVVSEQFSLSWCVSEDSEGNEVMIADVQQLQLGEGLKEGKPGEKRALNNLWEVLLLSSPTVYSNERIPRQKECYRPPCNTQVWTVLAPFICFSFFSPHSFA